MLTFFLLPIFHAATTGGAKRKRSEIEERAGDEENTRTKKQAIENDKGENDNDRNGKENNTEDTQVNEIKESNVSNGSSTHQTRFIEVNTIVAQASTTSELSNQFIEEFPMPRDAKVVVNLLASMGVTEFEPRVVSQLLDFLHGILRTNDFNGVQS